MTRAQVFPTLLIALQVGAGVVYAWNDDARRAIYWFAAAVINAAVTY